MRNFVKVISKNVFLSNFSKMAGILTFILFSSFLPVFAETSGNDDIFAGEKVEDGDFYKILLEPSKKEISDENARLFNEVKQKKLAILKKIEAERKGVSSAKKSVESAKEKQRLALEKNKAKLKNPQSKKQVAEAGQTEEPVQPVEKPQPAKKAQPAKKPQTAKKAQPVKPGQPAENEQLTEPVQTVEKGETFAGENVSVFEAEKNMDIAISQRKKFIDFGMEYKGTSYVWGGKTPVPGFDCSGFVSYAAKKSLGLNLSGNAQNIYDKTVPVSLSEALPGDLIFFKGQSDSRITHVGIYLGKNPGQNDFGKQNLFLNAASGGPRTGVIISGLNENYWKKTFYGCGRILPEV